AIQQGKGVVSLGCIAPKRAPALAIDRFERIRALVADGESHYDLPVTDLRLYENDHQSPRETAIADIGERLARGVPVIVSVGVTRAFSAPEGEPALHWLQVNNLPPAADPSLSGLSGGHDRYRAGMSSEQRRAGPQARAQTLEPFAPLAWTRLPWRYLA